jgi:hypothetical protein
MIRSRAPRLVVMIVALFCLAPTPGDIGGCGQTAEDLDAPTFFATLEATDCRACQTCGITSATCSSACDPKAAIPAAFPPGCAPLAHDGEVCLRRLQNDSCDTYGKYVGDDEAGKAVPITSRPRPSECQFCPVP